MAVMVFFIVARYNEVKAQHQHSEGMQQLQAPDHTGGGGSVKINCFYVQTNHAPDFSWITVMCAQSAYDDPAHTETCICGTPSETWYL